MIAILKGIGLLVAGLVFGLIADYVAYRLLAGMVCEFSHPNTCFVTQHGAFRPIVHAFLWCIPVASAASFVLLLSSGKAQRVAQLFLVLLVTAIMILMFID